MTQEQLISRYNAILNERIALRKEEYDILTKMIEFAPHKLGEIVNYKKVRTTNTGSFWNTKFIQTVKEGKGVVTGITPKIYRDKVFYDYDFSPFKKDGKLSKNHIHLREEDIECTGEVYQGTI